MALERWPTVSIGEVCDGIFDGPHATPAKIDSGAVFLGIWNIENGRIDLSTTEHISEADWPRWTRRVEPTEGDLVFSYETKLGCGALIPAGLRCCLGRRMALARPNRRKVDPRFLLYTFLAPEFQESIRNYTISGSTVDRIPLLEFPKFPMKLPPLPEQRAIARVLGALDDKIELNRRMNRTLEDLARGLFRSWFVDFDPVVKPARGTGGSAHAPHAPNRDGGHGAIASGTRGATDASPRTLAPWPTRLVDSPIGPVPEGWRVGTVADLARYVNGRNFTKNASGTGRMVVRIAELNSGPGGSTVYNEVTAEPENVVAPGDLLFAWSGSLDVYRWHRDEALVNQHIFKVVCEAYPQWFVHFHLCEAMPFFQGIAADKATTMGHIKREHLRQAELALPTDAAMRFASEHIEPIYARLLANERETLRLAATRDALLPVLLSGEVRLRSGRDEDRAVRDAERAAGEALQSKSPPSPAARSAGRTNGSVAAGAKGRE